MAISTSSPIFAAASGIAKKMNLVILAALIAACGAAKLDRTYLPPASAKTAGGSPGSLQTPFTRGSTNFLNNGLGGLPKGSYENDFEGVVVDASAAGTRTSEPGETGLGAPRISYGSTNSRVGAAAFKTRPSAFAAAQTDETLQGSQGSSQTGPDSAFEQGSFQTGTNTGFQQGSSQGRPNSAVQKGSFQTGANTAFQQVTSQARPNSAFQQNFQNGANDAFPQGFSGPQQPERQRASLDRTASILRYENENNVDNYHYAFETDNGISAEENGVATNGVQAQGGFSYTGDDGQVYSVSYTADEKGYQPKGDHLPTPPPIPEEILKSLEQNAKDEAAGLVDDGSYDAQRYNAGSDYAESGDANSKYTHQSSKFGGSEADAETFNQNKPSRRPAAGQSNFVSQTGQGSRFNGQSSKRKGFGASSGQEVDDQSQTSNRFGGQFDQSSEPLEDDSASGQFGQASTGVQNQNNGFGSTSSASTIGGSKRGQSRPGFGNRNEYLPPVTGPNVRPQSGRPMKGRPQTGRPQSFLAPSQEINDDEEGSGNAVPLGQQNLQDESRPQQALTSFGKPISSETMSQNGLSASSNKNKPTNRPKPSLIGSTFAQGQSSQSGSPNEYLPPRPSSPIRRPLNKPQNDNNFVAQLNQQNDENPEESDDSKNQSFSNSLSNGSPFGSQSGQQSTSFKKPQSYRPGQTVDSFPSKSETTFNSAAAQSSFGVNSQKATVQPATELTTPFESSNAESSLADSQSGNFAQSSQASFDRPTQPSFSNQYDQAPNAFEFQSNARPQASRPQKPRPFGTQAPVFPTQASVEEFNSNSQFANQPLTQNSFGQNEDTQYSSSTQRPSFTGQPQGPDDSYYYKPPSKPFGTPQASRFPSAPSNQFDRVTQQSSFAQNQIPNVPSTGFTKQPRPPTLAPTSPTAPIQSQFGNNYPRPGSTKQPRPPTLAPTVPTGSVQSQYQSNTVNGVTQASISPFPAQTPTQASQGQFGSFQQSQFTQSARPSFGQKPNPPSFGQPSRRPSGSFQSQTFGQQVESLDEPSNDENQQPVPSQQYTGEIYEYTKPAVTLPPPDSTPVSPSGQFGQKMPGQGQFTQSQTQFVQANEEEELMPDSQFNGQSPSNQGSRPQFGQSKPSIQNKFGGQAKPDEDTKPFGALAQSQAMFGSQTFQQSKPQFGQSRPQFGQTQSSFDQSQNAQDSEEGTQPESGIELSSDEDTESQTPEGPKNQFGFVSACCKENASRKPVQSQFVGQSQFAQSSFTGAQKQPTNSFSGIGEQFGGPRKPPSYDEETGYHY